MGITPHEHRRRTSIIYYEDYGQNREIIPFPEDARGFFYYRPRSISTPMRNTQPSEIAHVKSPSSVQENHDSTRSIGQIVFRITKDNDPASFASGRDLVQHNGDEPWCLVPRKNAGLWRLLLQDGLVTASTNGIARSNVPEPISNVGDPFIIDLSTWVIRVTVRSLRSGAMLPITVANPYRVRVGETRIYRLYYQGE